jgi:hypothetical protein
MMTPHLERSIQPATWTDRWRTFIVGLLLPVAVALALSAYMMPR